MWSRGVVSVMVVLLSSTLGCSSAVVNPTRPPAISGNPLEYRIQPGDQMDIKFFYNPELNESITVRPDGRVSLQLAHEIPAAGLTPPEFTRVLREKYARELNDPEVTVIMRNFAGQRIYVDGEVNKPSLVPLEPSTTVLQSISLAGGLKDSARTDAILIIRKGPEGKPLAFTVGLTRVLDGTDTGRLQ